MSFSMRALLSLYCCSTAPLEKDWYSFGMYVSNCSFAAALHWSNCFKVWQSA